MSAVAQRRVRAAAKELGYVPNGAAQSLSKSRSTTLGVLLPALYGEFFSEVMRGIDGTARRAGYHLLLASSRSETRELEIALRSMRGRVDGLIVMAPDRRANTVIASLTRDFPTVLINSAESTQFSSVAIDNFEGARAMVRHLIALGHQRIAMIAGPDNNHDAAERLRGYRAALEEHAHAAEAGVVVGSFTEASGYQAITGLLRLKPRPTALFAANDSMAIGALSALRERSLVVPDDMAIAGFDDLAMARYTNPPLSSVAIDIAALGQRAAERVLDLVRRGTTVADGGVESAAPLREVVATRLVIRQSCGAAAHTSTRSASRGAAPSARRSSSVPTARRSSS